MKNSLLPCCLFASAFLTGMPVSAQTGSPDSIAGGPRRITFAPETLARWAKADQSAKDAAVSLRAGRYAEAEAEARQALAGNIMLIGRVETQEVLAAALDAQGKRQEALQVYHSSVRPAGAPPHFILSYALLLANSGHWNAAVPLYTLAQSRFPIGLPIKANCTFSLSKPQPEAFRVAVHTALGFASASDSWRSSEIPDAAIKEYAAALRLAPDNPLANYYFAQEWQRLDPAVRGKFGTAEQAKAHLEKAGHLGSGDAKDAAIEALNRWSNSK